MTAFLRRLGYWLRGRRAADELDEELRFHREMAEQDMRHDGVSASDAQRAVRRTMGNTTLAREDARAEWVAPWIDALWQDVRHGMRSLRRSPGLVVVSALSLGLGIGLNTILFMVTSTVYGHEPTMVDPDASGRRRAGLRESVFVSGLSRFEEQRHLRRRRRASVPEA